MVNKEVLMGRSICITSGKGGVGKTTITAALGCAISNLGYSVVVVDTDFGLNNLDLALCAEMQVVYNLADCLEGRCRIRQALLQDAEHENLYLLASTQPYTYKPNKKAWKACMQELEDMFDFVLIDSPAGVDANWQFAVEVCHEVLVVVVPQLASLRDADKVLSFIEPMQKEGVGLIVNRYRTEYVVQQKMLSSQDIEEALHCEVVGCIPEIDVLTVASVQEIGIHMQYFENIAQTIISGEKRVITTHPPKLGVWNKIKKIWSRSAI